MNPKEIHIKIEDGTYGFDLKQKIYVYRNTNPSQSNILDLILKLLRVDLLDFDTKKLKSDFNDGELSTLKSIDINIIENKEVIARWLDVLLTLDKKYLKENIKLVRTSYADIYHTNGDYIYLMRSVALVRYAKKIFEQDSDVLFEEAKKAVINPKTAYLQKRLLIEMVGAFGLTKCQKEFSQKLNEQISDFYKNHDFDAVRISIETLHSIKSLSAHECRIKLAESYELEADHQVSNKQPNTFYPTISQNYLKGLRLLTSIPSCEELRKRLEKKVAEEQQEDFKMVQTVGVNLFQDIDFQELRVALAELEINSFNDGYRELLNIPIIPQELIEKQVPNVFDSNSFLATAFPQQVKVNNKGAHVATQSVEEGHANFVRTIYRERILAFIHAIKNKMDVYDEVTESFIDELLNRIASPFIPDSRKYLYVIGITKGFNNDFITAAHILMPQVENSLRHIAVQSGVNVTTWEKEKQHENLLGGCLEKLRHIGNSDLIDEMISFLVDGNSRNFRNDLLHGLMEPLEIQKYGMYLWWVKLKLVVQTKVWFPNLK
ncbi:DUF4209 domain-containing protein [Sphingobacterium hotanense]|uniref:DUF4209 domain-containing protein n=1 Tax=Sphingobacterium hotanense TaxID=649196 RepID=A0ABT7NKF9_9SPHI|nr:DUF4209 domain-containing protein [Sphingobacterium hotanense]MDM1047668.1 DUF4209 domain-containing protein [Sphingobacterium hotanense]